MKKLLAMVVVLGLASISSAALSLQGVPAAPLPGSVVTISVAASDDAGYDFGVGLNMEAFSDGVANLVNPAKGPATGDLYSAQSFMATHAAWFFSSKSTGLGDPPQPNAAGDRIFVDLVVADMPGAAFEVILYNASLGVLERQSVSVVPEPITMALLGVGGLFLRRRLA